MMDLTFSLPAYSEPAKGSVETRPKHVQEWLQALPLANGPEASRQLTAALIALNGSKLSEETRCHLLEMYRETSCTLVPALQQLYVNKSLPLAEKSLEAAVTVRTLQAELANGYKLALMDLSTRRANLATHKLVPLCLLRAMQCLGCTLESYYESYTPVPTGQWSGLHRLYWYAAKLNVHQMPIAGEVEQTINMAYAQILLVSLVDPYRLLHGQLPAIKDYLSLFVKRAQLQSLAPTENKHGLFLVRLDSDKPPRPLMHYQGVTDARTDILLNTIPLARQIHEHLQRLEAKEDPTKIGLPDSAKQAGYRALLKRLIKQWGATPRRMFHRNPTHVGIRICGGISSVHRVLSDNAHGEQAEDEESGEVEVSDLLHATSTQSIFNCAPWVQENESAGGMALSLNPGSYCKIKVGDLVGLDASQAGQWGVGLVRWMQTAEEGRIQIGAQLMAPQAEAVAIKPVISAANALFQPALLLPEMPALKQPACLVAAHGSYQPMREFEVRNQGLIHIVRADKLIEQTESCDIFTFC